MRRNTVSCECRHFPGGGRTRPSSRNIFLRLVIFFTYLFPHISSFRETMKQFPSPSGMPGTDACWRKKKKQEERCGVLFELPLLSCLIDFFCFYSGCRFPLSSHDTQCTLMTLEETLPVIQALASASPMI